MIAKDVLIFYEEIQEQAGKIRARMAEPETLSHLWSDATLKNLRIIMEYREKWLEFFSSQCSAVCGDCRGGCCYSRDFRKTVLQGSLTEVAIIGAAKELLAGSRVISDFELPVPDFSFLEEMGRGDKRPCLMLGCHGCLLKGNRPNVCLTYVCEIVKEELMELSILGEQLEGVRKLLFGMCNYLMYATNLQGLSPKVYYAD